MTSIARRAGSAALWCVCAMAVVACVGESPAQDVSASPKRGQRIDFAFETLDGRPLSTATLAGRFSVIGFATTYDLPSQAQARFLTAVWRRHTPRVNVALLILEPEDNRPLVDAYVGTLKLAYPVAFADPPTIAGRGPFAGLHHVPSVVVLDPQGHEAWRHIGLADEETIRAALRDVGSR